MTRERLGVDGGTFLIPAFSEKSRKFPLKIFRTFKKRNSERIWLFNYIKS